MTPTHSTVRPLSFLGALQVQLRVIGALIMRELHTRYGRDNIGYLWLIGEPLLFGSAIALLHTGSKSEGSINPVAFTVLGYCIFIIFRGVVARSEGSLEANAPLLYHKMVTVLDIVIARTVLEVTGCFMAFLVLLSIIIVLGYATLPVRPLYIILGVLLLSWFAFSLTLIITGATYEKQTLGRLVHPFTYLMMPLSGAFYEVSWLPQPYRDIVLWSPLPHIFEMVRYGQFLDGTLEFVDVGYVVGCCLFLTLIGLLTLNVSRRRIQLA